MAVSARRWAASCIKSYKLVHKMLVMTEATPVVVKQKGAMACKHVQYMVPLIPSHDCID